LLEQAKYTYVNEAQEQLWPNSLPNITNGLCPGSEPMTSSLHRQTL